MSANIGPRQLLVRLVSYYAVVIAGVSVLMVANADLLELLPFGGIDALESAAVRSASDVITQAPESGRTTNLPSMSAGQIGKSVLLLGMTLVTTLIVMLPVTWTFFATQHDTGPSRMFVRAPLPRAEGRTRLRLRKIDISGPPPRFRIAPESTKSARWRLP